MSLAMIGLMTLGFADGSKNYSASSNAVCELMELENMYQDVLRDLQTIETSNKTSLMQTINHSNLEMLESNSNFSRYSDKISYLLSIGITGEAIANQLIVANSSMLQKKYSNLYFGPCYDRWENSITSASAAFSICVIGASPAGVVGFAACSVGFGFAVLAADELYEDCMSSNYGPHDPGGAQH